MHYLNIRLLLDPTLESFPLPTLPPLTPVLVKNVGLLIRVGIPRPEYSLNFKKINKTEFKT